MEISFGLEKLLNRKNVLVAVFTAILIADIGWAGVIAEKFEPDKIGKIFYLIGVWGSFLISLILPPIALILTLNYLKGKSE